MRSPEYSPARLRLALLLSVPLVFSFVFFAINQMAEHDDTRVLDLNELRSGIGGLRGVANDAEVGEHGFLLTDDDSYLTTLDYAAYRFQSVKKSLAKTTVDPDLRSPLSRLVALVQERVGVAKEVIDIDRKSGRDAAIAAARNGDGQSLMQQVRGAQDWLQNEIGRRTRYYEENDHQLTRWAFLIFLIGNFTMLLVMLWVYNSFSAHMDTRDAAHRQMQRLNAELEGLNTDLEHRIEERTRELQRFNEELQQFAYVASHDLQEPLRTITSFTQLLATRYAGKFDEDADEFIGYIVSSAHRMTDLINGLLALLRLRKAGTADGPVSLAALVRDAEVSLQAQIRENDASVIVGDMPELVVDRLQFTQVFQNLISNAIKYRGAAAPLVTIRAKRDQSHWIIAVQDNGRGFDQQFAERIFGIFQRLHGREVEGTGMGLSIALRIVERHGGRMWAESSEGRGATFFFSLPVSLEAKAGDEEDVAAAAHHP